MKIALVLLATVVLLAGSLAKNKIPGCSGNKKAVCKRLQEKTKEFNACKEEKKTLQEENDELKKQNGDLQTAKDDLMKENEDLKNQLAECQKPTPPPEPVAKNCVELLRAGNSLSGRYNIDPDGKGAFEVYCDMKTDGGGWVLIQRRQDGSVDFSCDWNDYKNGFGTVREWWLGLEKIHRLTSQTNNELRLGLIDQDGKSAQALYSGFKVGGEDTGYTLTVGPFAGGTAGDSMSVHNGRKFSTKDRDNDLSAGSNCAVSLNGGWWYYGVEKCADANLNGQYGKNVFYRSWKGGAYSLGKTAMRVRPTQ